MNELKLDRPIVKAMVDEIVSLALTIDETSDALREDEKQARRTKEKLETMKADNDALRSSLQALHPGLHPNNIASELSGMVKDAKSQ